MLMCICNKFKFKRKNNRIICDSKVYKNTVYKTKKRPSVLHTIINHSPSAIIVIDINSIIVEWSEKTEEIYGYKQYEVIGECLTNLIIPEEYRKRHTAGILRYLETKKSKLINNKNPIALPTLHRDGHIIPVHLFLSESISETGEILFIGFIEDVTKTNKHLETIKHIEDTSNTFNLFLMSVPSPISVFTDTASCIFRNKAFQQLNNCNCINLNCKCTFSIINNTIIKNNIINVGKYGIPMQFKMQSINEIGRYYNIDILRAVYDNKCLVLLYFVDVTDKVTNKNDSCYFEFRERQISINSKMKSDFLEELGPKIHIQVSSIEDCLNKNNDFNKINDNNNTIINNNSENKKTIRKFTKTLFDIVHSIKNISKLDSEVLSNNIDLNYIIDNIYIFYSKKASLKAIRFDLNLSLNIKDTYYIKHGDKIQIILKELLDNAVKFTKNGYISLDVIDLDTHINIIVKDTGLGIEESFIDKLFKPFSKHKNDDDDNSLGLGLYIVQTITVLLKGSITVDSQLGQGSCFNVNIPIIY